METTTHYLLDIFRKLDNPTPAPELTLVLNALEQILDREEYIKLEELFTYALESEREAAFLLGAKTMKEILLEAK